MNPLNFGLPNYIQMQDFTALIVWCVKLLFVTSLGYFRYACGGIKYPEIKCRY